jgi:hypothetical protein
MGKKMCSDSHLNLVYSGWFSREALVYYVVLVLCSKFGLDLISHIIIETGY